MGTGMKIITRSPRQSTATSLRAGDSGLASTGGCRVPVSRRSPLNTANHTIQLSPTVASVTSSSLSAPPRNARTPKYPQTAIPRTGNSASITVDIRSCRRPKSAYATCPPSSWPMGSKLSMVTNNPTQPASATGCRKMSLPSGIGPWITHSSSS
jgi:hypothetical protein